MKRSSKDLKQLAREQLAGKYGTFIGTYVILTLIISAVIFIPAIFYQTDSLSGLIIREVISYILSLVISIFSIGMLQLSLNASRGKAYSVADLFYGFRRHPDRIIVVAFLCLLINLIYTIPYTILFQSAYSTLPTARNILTIPALAVITCIGYVISYFILLRFQLVYYILLDNDQIGAIEAMRTSARLMKGNKGRMFYLDLSFIGLTLLGVLSFGIGLLWVYPYTAMTMTQFYREAIGELDTPSYGNSIDSTDYQRRSYPADFY